MPTRTNSLEEKAGQLSLSSRYRSEFIANMSHELSTPLNGLLILAEQLQDNPENTMTDRQVEYAGVILNSGKDLLGLLNRILELAKVVLMDIMMPGMDGYATIRAIQALDQFKSLPILAVTGTVVGGERERCLAAGANDYVPKPVNTAALLAALRPWLPVPALSTP